MAAKSTEQRDGCGDQGRSTFKVPLGLPVGFARCQPPSRHPGLVPGSTMPQALLFEALTVEAAWWTPAQGRGDVWGEESTCPARQGGW